MIAGASRRSIYAFRHQRFEADAAFFNGYPRSECPFCGGRVARAGLNRNGIQRYRCASCARASTPVTGTIFDNSKLLKGVPDELNPLDPVNRMCFMLKGFLGAHQGLDRDRIQGYLDLLYVAMSDPADKLEKVAFVLDRAMRCPKTLRFATSTT